MLFNQHEQNHDRDGGEKGVLSLELISYIKAIQTNIFIFDYEIISIHRMFEINLIFV